MKMESDNVEEAMIIGRKAQTTFLDELGDDKFDADAAEDFIVDTLRDAGFDAMTIWVVVKKLEG